MLCFFLERTNIESLLFVGIARGGRTARALPYYVRYCREGFVVIELVMLSSDTFKDHIVDLRNSIFSIGYRRYSASSWKSMSNRRLHLPFEAITVDGERDPNHSPDEKKLSMWNCFSCLII